MKTEIAVQTQNGTIYLRSERLVQVVPLPDGSFNIRPVPETSEYVKQYANPMFGAGCGL